MSSLTPRIEKAAQFLGCSPEKVLEALQTGGITNDCLGLEILDASYTTELILWKLLAPDSGENLLLEVPELRRKAAIHALKTPATVNKTPVEEAAPSVSNVLNTILVNRRPAEMKDRELLELYVKDRDSEIELELSRRANSRRFIVLMPGKYDPGKEIIDLEKSLTLLKMARKCEVPSMAPFEGTVLQIYRITELNPEDRKTEICPFCGEALFRGYCDLCELDFGGIGTEERSYLKLITAKPSFVSGSFSDRRAAYVSAKKGLEDLKNSWPSVAQEFEDKKATNTLPQLVFIKPTPSTKKADPFAVGKGNPRVF